MPLRTLGHTDIAISPIIMGTWQAGRDMWTDIDDAATTRAIQAAVDNGLNTIDTAPVYGKGHSERVIAKAVGRRRSPSGDCPPRFSPTNWRMIKSWPPANVP